VEMKNFETRMLLTREAEFVKARFYCKPPVSSFLKG